MSKFILWIQKNTFSLLSMAAMLYIAGISNVLCCGPTYQPHLPEEANRFKKHL